jgi:hypothetical protein
VGVVRQLAVGETQGAVTGAGQRRIARALERVAGAVEVPAIGLDDDAGGFEGEVDLEAGDPGVDSWVGQAGAAAECEEALLELAIRDGGAGVMGLERSSEAAGTVMAGVGPGQRIESGVVGQLADLRLVERLLERSSLEDRGKVEQRPRGGRGRNAVVDGDLVRSLGLVSGGCAGRGACARWCRGRSRRSAARRWRAGPIARPPTRG